MRIISLLFHHNVFVKKLRLYIEAIGISDVINIFGIVVNALLAFWIVYNIQRKLTDKRFLKDYFITESKDLRLEYRHFLSKLYSGKISANEVIPWLKLVNIRSHDIAKVLYSKYQIDKDYFKDYNYRLKSIVTEFDTFVNNYKRNGKLNLKKSEKNKLIKFQQDFSNLFNDLIILINDKA